MTCRWLTECCGLFIPFLVYCEPACRVLNTTHPCVFRLTRIPLKEEDWWPEGKGRRFRSAARERWERAREIWRVQRRPRYESRVGNTRDVFCGTVRFLFFCGIEAHPALEERLDERGGRNIMRGAEVAGEVTDGALLPMKAENGTVSWPRSRRPPIGRMN